jgi:hypothetical protein
VASHFPCGFEIIFAPAKLAFSRKKALFPNLLPNYVYCCTVLLRMLSWTTRKQATTHGTQVGLAGPVLLFWFGLPVKASKKLCRNDTSALEKLIDSSTPRHSPLPSFCSRKTRSHYLMCTLEKVPKARSTFTVHRSQMRSSHESS